MYSKGRGSRDFLDSFDLQQPMQSVYITTKVVSWNPVHGVLSVYWLVFCSVLASDISINSFSVGLVYGV
jgi:hypothetical protein